MAIATLDALFNALGTDFQRFMVDKSSIANLVAGQQASLWRATGTPGQGAIPTAAAIPTSATLGAITLTNAVLPRLNYLSWLMLRNANANTSVDIADRVAHQAALVLNLATSQTTNLPIDVVTLGLSAARRGAANYSNLTWFLEVYADGGATASNATINVTYNDGTTGNLNVVAVGGTLRAGRVISLTPFIPTADQGKFIRGINSVILSASTGTAGNFGFTCLSVITGLELPIATVTRVATWDQLGHPSIENDECLQFLVTTSTTSSGQLTGTGKITGG
ncbi:MAG TPA: hypothetical protein VE861_00495 [Gemmatimonadaceae bacterium]|nr:hypothetical protein [Gemmatimonadaceae bacterium]